MHYCVGTEVYNHPNNGLTFTTEADPNLLKGTFTKQ